MKISMITVTFNDVEHLKLTLESNLSQTYKNYECIVIDGGSKDNTINILKEYEQKFAGKLKWISESDKGIFDAINKGIKLSTGDLIGIQFDILAHKNVLKKMVQLVKKENTDGIHGDLVYIKGNKIIRYWKNGNGKIKDGWSAAHPTLYLKKEIYNKYGLYKIDYKCAADYEFEVRILKDGKVKLSYLPEVLVNMFYGGTSTNNIKSYIVSLKEGHKALKENDIKMAYIIDLKRCLRVIIQFIRKRK